MSCPQKELLLFLVCTAVAVVNWQCSAMTHIGALCDVAKCNAEALERRCSEVAFIRALLDYNLLKYVFHSM